jgi:hypothetical protein
MFDDRPVLVRWPFVFSFLVTLQYFSSFFIQSHDTAGPVSKVQWNFNDSNGPLDRLADVLAGGVRSRWDVCSDMEARIEDKNSEQSALGRFIDSHRKPYAIRYA